MDRRGRGRRTRGRGRGATRRKKSVESKDELSIEETTEEADDVPKPVLEIPTSQSCLQTIPTLDMDADISQLEAPTFTTISRGPPEPMLRLRWGHTLNLIGEKVLNPLIYCCDTCLRPILIYGRMIPCRHVFCLACAQKNNTQCARCGEKCLRAEQAGLGTVFMCTHGGSRYGNTGCRRTYLSERDLQAHINHRHMPGTTTNVQTASSNVSSGNLIQAIGAGKKLQDVVGNVTPRTHNPPNPSGYPPAESLPSTRHRNPSAFFDQHKPPTQSYTPDVNVMQVPPPSRTGNLITVPIQEPVVSVPPPAAQPYYPTAYPAPPIPASAYYPPPATFEYPPPPTTADTSIPPPWPPPPQNAPFYG